MIESWTDWLLLVFGCGCLLVAAMYHAGVAKLRRVEGSEFDMDRLPQPCKRIRQPLGVFW